MIESRSKNNGSGIECNLQAHGLLYTVAVLYFLGNALLFLFSAKEEYSRHDDFQKYVTGLARGAGAILNLNMSLVPLFACRMLLKFLHDTPLSLIAPIDFLMPGAHSFVGSLVVVFGMLHSVAHIVTFALKHPWSSGMNGATSLFISGVLLAIALLYIRASSCQRVRSTNYELFQRSHMASFILIYVLLPLHGFHHKQASTWKWIIGPVLVYSADYLLRMFRERRSYLLLNKHAGVFQGNSILKLRLPRVFHFQPGQYAELKVPEISRYQWHPFTIASAPHEPEMVFYVKTAGDWTTQLFRKFAHRLSHPNSIDIEIHVRGPFGAPAQHVDQFEHLVLIGGGVGATPFCSVVKSLYYWMTTWSPFPETGPLDTRLHEQGADLKENGEQPETFSMTRKAICSSQSSIFTGSLLDGANSSFFTAKTHQSRQAPTKNQHPSPRSSRVSPPASIDLGENYVACSSNADTAQMALHGAVHLRFATIASSERAPAPHRVVDTGAKASEWDAVSNSSYRRDFSYWNAVNSLRTQTNQSNTFYESLDLLIGMNYAPPSMVRHMQVRKLQRSAEYLSGQALPTSAVDDLSIFHDRRFLFLIYSKSVTANMVLLWIVMLRWFLAGLGGLLGDVSLFGYGLSIYRSRGWLVCDTCLTLIVFLGVVLPASLEVFYLGPDAPVSWMDHLVFVPVTVFEIVTNSLALADIGGDLTLLGVVKVFLVWPLTVVLILVRLVRVVGDRVSYGRNSIRGTAMTQSVKFFWTAPTQEDDSWLVEELLPCASEEKFRLYRYITRAEPRDESWMLGLDQIPIRTEYCRPDWEAIFNEIAEKSANGATVGVFLCGPSSMAQQVEVAAMAAMRNSIVRGLQKGICPMKKLEEVFGNTISANAHTGETVDRRDDEDRGCNIKMVFHKERFS